MKLLGLALIMASSAVFGITFTGLKQERINELQSFSLLLEFIRAELSTNSRPLPELLDRIVQKLEWSAAEFIKVLILNLSTLGEKDFDTLWRESIKVSVVSLNENEVDALSMLGSVLGKYDIDMQITALDEVLVLLKESEREESLQLPQAKRLNMGVSLSFGALLSIMLV